MQQVKEEKKNDSNTAELILNSVYLGTYCTRTLNAPTSTMILLKRYHDTVWVESTMILYLSI